MTYSKGGAATAKTEALGLAGRAADHPSGEANAHGARALVPRRWLTVARVTWVAVALLTAALFIIDFPKRSTLLLVVAPVYAPGLASLGMSTSTFRAVVNSIELFTMLAFWAVGFFMFWRRSDEWVALVGSLALVAFGAMPTFLRFGARVFGPWSPPSVFLLALGTALSISILFIFPDGHFFPRWTVVPTILVCAWTVIWPLFPDLNAYNWPVERTDLVLTALYATGGAVIVYRYRHTVSLQQRLQMKWVIYSFALTILIWAIAGYPRFAAQGVLSSQAYSLASLATGVALMLSQLLVPVAFAVSILRYRLWDIDILINRTLVYLPLTGILAGVYAASIALLQRVFQAFTGQKSDAAVVITTLLLVGVFSPIKDALQHLVERRYRETNDPTALLRAFGQHVRSVADVFDARRMTEQALQTAAAALGAPAGAFYLERNGESRLVHACGEWTAGEVALDMPLEAQGMRLGSLQLAARSDGKVYSARECDILRETIAEVARVVYLVETGYQFTDDKDAQP